MTSSPTDNSLLIEILCEELPPHNLQANIGEAFAQELYAQLAGFLTATAKVQSLVTPRRFGCLISGINYTQADQELTRKGPAVISALKDGQPTQALLGFAKSCGTEWQHLTAAEDGYFYFTTVVKGKQLPQVLTAAVGAALKKIQIVKAMRWGDSEHQFVRPVHNLVAMFNQEVIACEAFGLSAGNTTRGHRFMGCADIALQASNTYFTQLVESGKVIPDFGQRRTRIEQQLEQAAANLGLKLSPCADLIDEVTALVEWPEVLVGSFAAKFLAVPQECLILSMAKNQKYFALIDSQGKLSNQFLFVANLISREPEVVIAGNQKVLSARLADAEFFYEFDQRTPLPQFVAKLAEVVYHNRLGSQFERITRLQTIAATIAPALSLDPAVALDCAYLLKADLVTEMVGEFPELQGTMGKYYAKLAGANSEIANAIEKHYYPRFSGDELPDSNLAVCVALADKLETLVGIWGIGLIPSGDKDPYALRRAALGVVRILLVHDLDLKQLLEVTFSAFESKPLAANTISEVYAFILQRLANYLVQVEEVPGKVVTAALASAQLDFNQAGVKKLSYLPNLLAAAQQFASNASNQSLFQANKRIENILKKNEAALVLTPIQPSLLIEAAEQTVFKQLNHYLNSRQLATEAITEIVDIQQWPQYFANLTQFNQPLDRFFNEVMVMIEDPQVRLNRLNLLHQLHQIFNAVLKLSELA